MRDAHKRGPRRRGKVNRPHPGLTNDHANLAEKEKNPKKGERSIIKVVKKGKRELYHSGIVQCKILWKIWGQ